MALAEITLRHSATNAPSWCRSLNDRQAVTLKYPQYDTILAAMCGVTHLLLLARMIALRARLKMPARIVVLVLLKTYPHMSTGSQSR